MKIPFLPIVAALALSSASSLHAQVLFLVNESNPSAVVITATGNAPSAGYSTTYFDGFDLLGFFTTDASAIPNTEIGSNLTTGDASTGPIFDTVYADDESTTADGNIPYFDLSLYNGGALGSSTESFTPGQPAFHGTFTFDSTGYTLSGTNNSVFAGTSFDGGGPNPGVVIGTYEIIVPEPSTGALMIGGLGLLAFCVHRKATRLS